MKGQLIGVIFSLLVIGGATACGPGFVARSLSTQGPNSGGDSAELQETPPTAQERQAEGELIESLYPEPPPSPTEVPGKGTVFEEDEEDEPNAKPTPEPTPQPTPHPKPEPTATPGPTATPTPGPITRPESQPVPKETGPAPKPNQRDPEPTRPESRPAPEESKPVPVPVPVPTPNPTPTPTPAPAPRPAPTPLPIHAFWDGRSPSAAKWTHYTLRAIEKHGQDLVNARPADIAEFCPKYNSLGAQGRKSFWVKLISAIAASESSFNPMARYREPAIVNRSGTNVVSRGLLQLSFESANAYDCGFTNEEQLHHPRLNIECGVRILSQWIESDGVISARADGEWRGGARYWAVLRSISPKKEIIRRLVYQTSLCRTQSEH